MPADARVRLPARSQERLQRFVGVNRAQRPRGFDAHAVKRVLVQPLFESGDRFLVLLRAQLFDGQQSPDRVVRVRQLRVKHGVRRVERDPGQQRVIGIEADYFRRGLKREIKILFLFLHLNRAVGRAEFALETNRERKVEQRNVVAEFLRLTDGSGWCA